MLQKVLLATQLRSGGPPRGLQADLHQHIHTDGRAAMLPPLARNCRWRPYAVTAEGIRNTMLWLGLAVEGLWP